MEAGRLRKGFMYNAGLLIVYKIILEILYVWCIYRPHWEGGWWNGPYDVNPTVLSYISALVACVAIIFLFHDTLSKPLQEYKFSEVILFVLLLLAVMPGLAMCGVGVFEWRYQGCFFLYWVLFFFLARQFSAVQISTMPLVGAQPLRIKRRLLFLLGIVVVFSVAFVFWYYGEGKFFTFGLQSAEVYVNRLKWRELSIVFPVNYIIANAVTVFLFLLLFSLKERRYGWGGLVLFAWYMDFSCGANKIGVFSMMAGVLVYAFRYYLSARRILYVTIAVALVSMGLYIFWGNVYSLSFLVRQMFDTNLLGYCYYDFFQTYTPMLQHFLHVDAGVAVDRKVVPFLIGDAYFGNSATSANNGLLGDALMMAGELGVLIGPVLWMAYLFVLDQAGKHLDWWIKLGTSVYWVAVMQNSSFVTSLLSHGGVAMIILAYLCGSARPDTEVLHNRRERPHLLKW